MPQNYNIIAVEDTSFEPDQYQNRFYSVRFEGEQNSVLWKTKQRPNLGPVYGHIEPSRSGKSRVFKKDKMEEGASFGPAGLSVPASQFSKPGKKSDDERSDDIRWGLCLKEANQYITKHESELDEEQWADAVNRYANALYKVSHGPAPEPEVVPDDYMGGPPVLDDEIDLGELPF